MAASDKVLAALVRKGGGKLIDQVARKLAAPAAEAAPDEGGKPGAPAGKSLLGGIAAAAAVRVATRSVPGAIVVGGGLLAKKLYDRRHARRGKGAAKESPRS